MRNTVESFTSSPPTGGSIVGVITGFSNKWSSVFRSAVFGILIVGTGGIATPRMINCIPSGSIVVSGPQLAGGNTDSDRLLDTQEKLAGIRRYLSMNVTNIARALRVRRPTVYSWLRDEPSVRPGHAQRLEAIYKIARKWRMLSSKPIGGFLNRQLASGTTVLELLSARTLDETAISVGFAQILGTLNRTPRVVSVMEVAKRRKMTLSPKQSPIWSSNAEIDV
ncbi:MAG: hypothetical protein ACRD20_00725 [Terriglobales bacterium]